MGVVRLCLTVFALICLFIPLASASVSYSLNSALANSATVSHGQPYTVSYQFENKNFACSVSCRARMVSTYYSIPYNEFSLAVGHPLVVQFNLHSPSKQESNYQPTGQILYNLKSPDISCNTIQSLLPLCSNNAEQVSAATADSITFTLNYGLSQLEQQSKLQYEQLVSQIKQKIEDTYNKGKELDSYYNNLKNNIKIPLQTQNNIQQLMQSGSQAYQDFQSSQDKYHVLEVQSALSQLSSYQNTDFASIQRDMATTHDELARLQQVHDQIVQLLKTVKTTLSQNSDVLQRVGLGDDYFSIVHDYEEKQSKIETLSFSSYEALRTDVEAIQSKLQNLLKKQQDKEKELIDALNKRYLSETTKIGSSAGLSTKATITETIQTFCSDFEQKIPTQFQAYNQQQEQQVTIKNQQNQKRNEKLESLRPKWEELGQTIGQILAIAKGAVFDKTLSVGCNITAIKNIDFTANEIDTTITNCKSFKNKLSDSVSKNSEVTTKFFNFFKFLFTKKPQLNQTELPTLDSFKQSTNLTYTSVYFDAETNTLIKQHCNFNPQTISLSSPKDVRNIGYETSNQKIQFANVQGTCEKLDCYNNRDTYPVLFVHGHLFQASGDPMVESRYTFDTMIPYLAKKYPSTYDAGTIVDKGNEFLDKGLHTNPGIAMFRTTYYGYAYIDSLGHFQFEKKNYESITEYAKKLNGIIDATLSTTGRKKLKIVTHSMGGLVVREYLRLYGNDKVDTLIMIGAPNNGIDGSIQSNCASMGGSDTECAEMASGSDFLKTLKAEDKLPERIYTIIGLYRDSNSQGDGIVRSDSGQLLGIKNYIYRSAKTNAGGNLNYIGAALGTKTLVHSDLVNPKEMPEVSDTIAQLLELK